MKAIFILKQNDLHPALQKHLRGLSITGRRRILFAMGRRFWEITRETFGVNGTNRPEPWAPLSESYKKRLRHKSFGAAMEPTLLRNGDLMNSIIVRTPSGNSIEIYTENSYAAEHQFGVASRKLPKRPFFPVDSGDRLTPYAQREITDAAERELVKIFKEK